MVDLTAFVPIASNTSLDEFFIIDSMIQYIVNSSNVRKEINLAEVIQKYTNDEYATKFVMEIFKITSFEKYEKIFNKTNCKEDTQNQIKTFYNLFRDANKEQIKTKWSDIKKCKFKIEAVTELFEVIKDIRILYQKTNLKAKNENYFFQGIILNAERRLDN